MLCPRSGTGGNPNAEGKGKKEADGGTEKKNSRVEAGTGLVGGHDQRKDEYFRTEQNHHTHGKGSR